jgi:hypothetical protein
VKKIIDKAVPSYYWLAASMKLYLDTRDLINILQRAIPCTVHCFENILRRGNHNLTISLHTVTELSVPILKATSRTNVMSLLNRLETLPITFVRSDIDYLELETALNSYSSKLEYGTIHAFVNRFDQTVDFHAQPSTANVLNYSMAETVWDLYSHGALEGLESYVTKMRQLMQADRRLKKPPALRANFGKMIERVLVKYKLSWSGIILSDFANWIYENPNRCPAIRLGYEVWHKIVKNKTDALEDSDMEDYQHLICLPYVDFMTLDRRMHSYVSQASASLGLGYRDRVFKSTQDLLGQL